MIRVLIVAEWINLNGGVTRTLLDLLTQMDPAEYDVTLYVMRPARSDLTAIPAHVRVVQNEFDLPYLGPQGTLKRLLRSRKYGDAIRFAKSTVAWKRGGTRADYLSFYTDLHPLIGDTFDIVASYAMLDSYSNHYVSNRVVSARKIMWCHTSANLYSDRELSGHDRIFLRFDAINCVSRGTESKLLERFPALSGRTRVRYNAMNEPKIVRLAAAEQPARPQDGRTVLTTIARLSPEKGIDILVDAAANLKNAGHQFLWWVVGPGFASSFAAEIKAKVEEGGLSDEVRFVGAKENPYPYISASDIYVQTSRVEGYCTSTAEAKILAKPVVCTDTSGASEQFESGVNGSIVPKNAEALSAEIARLIEKPEVRKTYQQALSADKPTPADSSGYFD